MCASRFQRTSREVGATRAAKPPKTERGGSVPNEFAPNLPRSVFRLAAGVAPSTGTLRGEAGRKPREGGGRFCEVGTTPRTTNRRIGACFASRGLRFASAILAATWTQRGRCGDALRGPRESFVHWGRRHAARFKRDVSGTRTQRRDLHRQGGAGLHVLPFPLVHLSPELH